MFSHIPAPIWRLYYILPPVTSVIPVFFHQSLFSHQYFNPFRPSKFRSTSFSSSRWTPFYNFFWESSSFHSLNTTIPLKLFPVPLCQPQSPLGNASEQTQGSAVRRRQLTTWATACHLKQEIHLNSTDQIQFKQHRQYSVYIPVITF